MTFKDDVGRRVASKDIRSTLEDLLFGAFHIYFHQVDAPEFLFANEVVQSLRLDRNRDRFW